MNHDENNPDLQTYIEPELEARLVAAVLGEASAFETAELNRLAGDKPEIAIFKRRIEAVHGLVGIASRHEQAPLRLAPERRAKILQTIGAAPSRTPSGATNNPVLLALEATRRKRRKKWIWGSSLAASFTLAAFMAINVMSSSRMAQRAQVNGGEFADEAPSLSLAEMPRIEAEVTESKSKKENWRIGQRIDRPSTPPAEKQIAQSAPSSTGAGAAGGAVRAKGLKDEKAARESALSADLLRKRNSPLVAVNEQRIASNTKLVAAQDQFGAVSEADVGEYLKNIPATEPAPSTPLVDDEIVKMDAFQVSAAREGNAQAIALQKYSITTNAYGSARANRIDPAEEVRQASKHDGFLSGMDSAESRDAVAARQEATVVTTAALDEDNRLSQEKAAATPLPEPPVDAPRREISAAKEPVSTFSLHVSDVSFRLAQAALARGETIDPARIRPEEFYNAFDYGDPSPTATDKISTRIEQSAHPLVQQRNLVRIAMKVGATGRATSQPLYLTVLLDTSGSMEREDRVASVQRALGTLASLLGANDRVTLVGFSRQPRLLTYQLPGNQAGQLVKLASSTPFTGGTNLEEALKLAGELARRRQNPQAQNRIVLITDGAANLGSADPAQLATMIQTLRQQGIAFDACGVGTDGLDDSILEALTRKGDGRYYILDKPEDADAGFARQLAGAFRPAAENVKVQVRFNPARVGSYRLIGFEQHRLREEDFRNDQVDAAELAAEEAAVAVYQVEVLPQGEGELGEVFVRFRDPAAATMVERSWTILYEPQARAFDRATPTIQLAGTAALLAEKLQGGEAAGLVDLPTLAPVVNGLRGHYASDARVQELITMFEQMRRREGR